ncbi:hypothetical protein ERHA55_08620 [Erwinia rhapontici]|nr:hypothetical protein ERHA55_08620 [Erwinia rhapontici]
MKSVAFIAGLALLLGLIVCSLFVGVSRVTLLSLWSDPEMREILLISRFPVPPRYCWRGAR